MPRCQEVTEPHCHQRKVSALHDPGRQAPRLAPLPRTGAGGKRDHVSGESGQGQGVAWPLQSGRVVGPGSYLTSDLSQWPGGHSPAPRALPPAVLSCGPQGVLPLVCGRLAWGSSSAQSGPCVQHYPSRHGRCPMGCVGLSLCLGSPRCPCGTGGVTGRTWSFGRTDATWVLGSAEGG